MLQTATHVQRLGGSRYHQKQLAIAYHQHAVQLKVKLILKRIIFAELRQIKTKLKSLVQQNL
ncbi:hypothetical protein FACHB389_15325 [Nostoc calcicola FACHB-389]|nr:hypothetical protein FACHB389_15325 [Nostoc calcicola FACHB-389]